MTLDPYRRVLALPGVRSLLLVSLLARVPVIATTITLTLYVVLELDRGYGAAGLVGAAITVGAALGAPVLGRLIDRRGLRLVFALTTLTQAAFWAVAPFLPYAALLVAALAGGLATVPVFSVVRQSIAALVPEAQRRPAYALDSMAVEVSFITGPALAVVLATTVSPRGTMLAVGTGIVLGGLGLFLLNPPIREGTEKVVVQRPRTRDWLRARMVAVLAIAAATTLVLVGTDVSIVAALRETGQLPWSSAVLAMWGVYSLAGGFAYGAARRGLPPATLLGLLGLATIPVGLAGGWWWLALALVPAGAFCAPTLTATADLVSRLAPATARGEAMGLHNSANTVGIAAGAPLAGAVIDASAPVWGFAAVGAVGVAVALAAAPLLRDRRRPAADQPALATAATG
jgi:predicted MFS family arabinose efflux permease